ncbi:MAG: TldD/PmbA family protein [Candidatus Aminicenantes bacterium]|nr:TldD/PmbA family protein [Candidatus Aminicenantes bacterium]
MEKFKTCLYEDTRSMQFALDHKDTREYSLKRKCGVLTRSFDGRWKSRAYETMAKDEIAKYMSWKSTERIRAASFPAPEAAGKIMADNAFLINFLKRSGLQEWKLHFRAKHCRRALQNTHSQESQSSFDHYSITARLKLKNHPLEMEVSEGSSEGLKFNLDGLTRRISETAGYCRSCRRVVFKDPVPVVLQAGEGAILFHEILGHALEADYVFHGFSPFSLSDLNKTIIPAALTILTQDSRDPFFKGSAVDDEGETSPSPLLVENGVLRRFIADFHYQKLLGLRERGHARLEDFSHFPLPRMFAIYVQPGDYPAEEILASTPYGVFAREFGDGGLDFGAGRFFFNIRQSYLIEKGRLTAPLGSLTVSGKIREILNDIGMVGNDFKYDRGVSYCQKNGQVLHVRVGQPTIKINKLHVNGGTGA